MKTIRIHNEQWFLEELRKNSKSAFQYFFERYDPALYFFISRLLKNDPASDKLAHDCFIKMIHNRNAFTDFSDIQSFLYTSANNACLIFMHKNNFLAHRKTLMGYNIITNRNTLLDIVFSETIFAIYTALKGQSCKKIVNPVNENTLDITNRWKAMHTDNLNMKDLPEQQIMEFADDIKIDMPLILIISALLKDLVLFLLYKRKENELAETRLHQLNAWLALNLEHSILLDGLKDKVNIGKAILFIENDNSRDRFNIVKRNVVFSSFGLFKNLRGFFNNV